MRRQNKYAYFVLALLLALAVNLSGQEKGLADRAFATHNAANLGYFTTNIGQFYPYGGQFEPTLEFPLNSGHIAMYRQCIMIGVPVNVISAADGRFEEFDAVGGFHNPANPEIAISDNPATWYNGVWPLPADPYISTAQQVSYCVYSDSTNWRYAQNGETDMLLNTRIHQTIYTWGGPTSDKFHILRFEIENMGSTTLSEM